MRLYIPTVFVLSVMPSFALSEEPEKVEVSIEVTRADGTPGRGAIAGHIWSLREYGPNHPFSKISKEERSKLDGPMAHMNELFTLSGIAADEDGHLTFAIEPSELPKTYFLMSDDHREGVIVRFVDLPDVLKRQGTEVRLKKLTTVKLDLVRPLPDDPNQSLVGVGVIHEESRSNIYSSQLERSPKEAHISTEFRLPPGQYKYYVQSDGCAMNLRDLVIDENQAGQEMRIEAKLSPKFIRAYAGKIPPPLCTTGNFGAISRDAMDNHKGRRLLLVFFREARCEPQDNLKKLFALYRELEQRQKDDRILIHCVRGVRDEKDYQAKVVDPIQREHKDIDFSVPVLLDGDLCTIRSWGIDQIPTAVLLDENGRVVEQGSPWSLWPRVEEPRDRNGP
jgi:hypothetical protein